MNFLKEEENKKSSSYCVYGCILCGSSIGSLKIMKKGNCVCYSLMEEIIICVDYIDIYLLAQWGRKKKIRGIVSM